MTRTLAPAALALGMALALWTSPARAQVGGDSGEWESPKRGSLGITGGLYYPTDTALTDEFGQNGLLHWDLTLGYRIFDFFKLDAGLFALTDQGHPASAIDSESTSAEESRIILMGLNAGPVLRLDFFREQPVVPYGTIGGTWALFKYTETEDAEAVIGDKGGWYWAAGLELLLDRLEPSRATDLDISRGINDTYLTLEFRRQTLVEVGEVDTETEGFDFSAKTLSIGLKFDF